MFMKYIITENKLHQFIKNYLNKEYGDLNSTCSFDDNGDEDWCAVVFYRDDYSDDDVIFRWYDCCYFDGLPPKHCPYVEFENKSELNALNGYFGDVWKPIFKLWFYLEFDMKVKDIR